MAYQSGILRSYSNTEPIKRTVTDRIIMADPMSIVMINALGLDNSSKFSFVNDPGLKYEWLEDTYVGRSTTVNDATSLTSATTATQFTVTTGALFQVGDVIQIDDEYMWVSAISTNTLTVTRGVAGTQATHANSVTVYVRSRARLEGDDADDSPSVEVTTGYNYSQIFQKTIKVTRSNALLNRYGIPDIVDREIDKSMDELMMLLAMLPYHGYRASGDATTARSAAGLETFITTNDASISSAALTQKHIEDHIQLCWDGGGSPDLLVCGAWVKRKLADMFAPYVRTERSENRGGITIDYIMSPLGIELAVVVDRFCPTDTAYILDTDYVGYITLDPFFEEDLGKAGDTKYYGQVVGEYGFVVAYEKAHSFISSISTSA